MQEDTTNTSANQLHAAAVANSEQTMADGGSSSNFIPNVGPSKGDVPNRLIAQTSNVVAHQPLAPIDVTDGKWHELILWKEEMFDWTTAKLLMKEIGNIMDINMYTIGGNAPSLYVNVGDGSNTVATFDPNDMHSYTHGQLKSVHIKLKNFMVQVERDSSGGVQWKDEPVFEVQAFPVLDYSPVKNVIQTAPPAYCYTTTLKEGIHTDLSVSSGVISKEHALKCQVVINGKTYLFYPSLGQWLCNDVPVPAVFDDEQYRGYPHLTCATYVYYVRLINIPAGMSNIKVELAYSSELVACWNSYGHVLVGGVFWDPPGTVRETRATQRVHAVLRALEALNDENDKADIQRIKRRLLEHTEDSGIMDTDGPSIFSKKPFLL